MRPRKICLVRSLHFDRSPSRHSTPGNAAEWKQTRFGLPRGRRFESVSLDLKNFFIEYFGLSLVFHYKKFLT